MGPERRDAEVYYRWVDASGRLHVVSSLDAVPEDARAKAERVELNAETSRSEHVGGYPAGASAPMLTLDWPSFGIGFGVALLLALLFRALPQGMRWVSRIAIMLCVAGLLLGAYFGAIRRTTGTGSGALASPTAFIDDAKRAVEKMNLRQQQQEQEIRRIQAEGK